MITLDDRAIDIYLEELCEFIRIPSRSTPEGGEEGPLQRLVAARMKGLGARVRTFDPADIPGFLTHPLCSQPERQYTDRPTVLGEIGPPDAPGLLVLAHSDTVPITKPGEWSFAPFCGEIRDGKILGLGVSDDKWGTATLLAILRALADSKKPLRKKVILASTVDEENGVGNGLLLLTLAGVKAEGAIYLDGYQMNILIGNLGGTFLILRPRDHAGEELDARHADRLREECRRLSLERAALFLGAFYRDNAMRESSINLMERKDAQGPCFVINFYTLPGEDKTAVCADLELMVKRALGEDQLDYEMNYRSIWFEPALISPDLPHVRCLASAVEETLGTRPVVTTISKQDAFVLTNHAGIPTVSFGPAGRVSGKGAYHSVDEYLTVEEAWTGCRIAADAVFRWLAI